MLWFCHYRAHDGVGNKELMDRYGPPGEGESFEMFKGIVAWYAFAGLTEGVVIIDLEDPMELTGILQPCRHLIHWEVKACKQIDMEAFAPSANLLR
jgi:hypothetical protein